MAPYRYLCECFVLHQKITEVEGLLRKFRCPSFNSRSHVEHHLRLESHPGGDFTGVVQSNGGGWCSFARRPELLELLEYLTEVLRHHIDNPPQIHLTTVRYTAGVPTVEYTTIQPL